MEKDPPLEPITWIRIGWNWGRSEPRQPATLKARAPDFYWTISTSMFAITSSPQNTWTCVYLIDLAALS